MEKFGWLTKKNKRNKKQQRFYVLDFNTKTLTYFRKPLVKFILRNNLNKIIDNQFIFNLLGRSYWGN